jgi:enoyl-CoA hydratase/carnithine racemase
MDNAPTPAPGRTPQLTVDGAVARITLARPAHRNRLQQEDLQALMRHIEQVDVDAGIRVLVLDAHMLPERPVFSAGYHTGEFDSVLSATAFEHVANALERVRPVTICALGGSVYGGATDLVLACDLVLGAEGIEMRMPAAALGLHYYPSGLARYVSRLGVSFAKRAFLTARPFKAEALLQAGYLHELVPADELEPRVAALAAHVASLAPLAVQSLKKSLTEIARGDYDVHRLQAREQATLQSEDFREGLRAFAEKRPPVWKGR